jgi:hypothetical protein
VGRVRAQRPRLLCGLDLVLVCIPAPAGQVLVLPGVRSGPVFHGLEHRGELHDQHQLAVLFRGVDHGPSGTDGRAGGAELRLRRGWRRGRCGSNPRLRPPPLRPPGQFLGRFDPDHAARSAANLRARRDRAHPRRRGAESVPGNGRDDARRRLPNGDRGTGCEPGGDQGVGHQWRWVLQRQFSPPIREPDELDELAGELPTAGDPVQHASAVRPDGRR